MSVFRPLTIALLTIFLTACASQTPDRIPTTPAALPAGDALAEVGEIRTLWNGAECKDPAAALTQLDALLAREPDNAAALGLRGLALSQQEQREAAFDSLTAAIRRAPTAQLYAWRALALWRGGNVRAASRDAGYALRKDAAQPVAVMVTGLVHLAQGNTKEACAALQRACAAGECSGLDNARASQQCPK